MLGAAGAHDQVSSYYFRTCGTALLLSVISAGVQLSRSRSATASPLAPTLDLRPGYAFNVNVTQDGPLPRSVPRSSPANETEARSQSRAGKTVGGVLGDLHETLTAYTRYSREEHGAAIDPWPFGVQMPRPRGRRPPLQTWQRRSNGASTADRSQAAGGTREKLRNG
jgi:hypothetical protein